MKRKKIAAFLLSFLFLSGCNDFDTHSVSLPKKESKSYQTITAEDAKKRMEEYEDYVLLDVRTEEEFEQKHIEGALLLPDYEIEENASKKLPDKDINIFVYCRSGRRSAAAAEQLANMGYINIFDFGGILDWPYETVMGNG